MIIMEVLQSAQYVVDKEDIAEIQQARQEEDTVFSWEQVVAEHKTQYHASNKMMNKSPLDVPGIKTDVSMQDILDAISESRSGRYLG